MKCPNCGNDQKHSEGMVCKSCRYEFTLSPKEKPYITDQAFKLAVDRLSGPDGSYFTYNQLYAAIHRLVRKKMDKNRYAVTAVLIVIGLFVSAVLGSFIADAINADYWPQVTIFIIFVALAVYFAVRPVNTDPKLVSDTIHKYTKQHPLERLADGTKFKDMDVKAVDKELFQFAPERILIVERDDMADMLLLNRFHVENKTLVVSMQRYPQRAYDGVKHFLSKNPELPVHIMHDASKEGLKMKESLETRKDWELKGSAITDLGLFPKDLSRLKDPVWRPTGRAAVAGGAAAPKGKDPREIINEGYRMPVDVAPPRAFMGTAALAMIAGAALLSPELMAQQQATGADGTSGGFG